MRLSPNDKLMCFGGGDKFLRIYKILPYEQYLISSVK